MRPASHPPIEIRPATSSDAEAISAVIVAAIRITNAADYPPSVIERIAIGFAPGRVAADLRAWRALVAVRDGIIIGTAALDGAVVRSVFVHPDAQRREIGASLMAGIVRLAASSGTNSLTLRSSISATNFYARLGFEAVRDLWHGDERTVEMRMPIRPDSPATGAV